MKDPVTNPPHNYFQGVPVYFGNLTPQPVDMAGAIELVLFRWQSREPGCLMVMPDISLARLVGYSPNFRVMHFRRANGETGWITRRAYHGERKP